MKKPLMFCVSVACVALFGFGCSSGSTSSPVTESASGVVRVDVKGMTPEQATQALRLMTPVVVRAKSHVGSSALTRERGFGPDLDVTMVIKEFSPRVMGTIDWKIDTDIAPGNHHQYTGTLSEIHLGENADVDLPFAWIEGTTPSDDTAGIWVSEHVRQNIARTAQSTMYVGLSNSDHAASLIKVAPQVSASMYRLRDVADRVKGTDTSLGIREEKLVEVPLEINGTKTTVQAWRVKCWFGTVDILANAENPMILNVQPSTTIPEQDLVRMADYHVTSIADLNRPL